MHFIKTERLLIRPTSEEDAEFLLELLNTPKWLKYIGDRNVKTIEAAREYVQIKILPQLESHGYTNNTVIRKSDFVKIGTCGLYDREGTEGIDIGFAFLPEYEKNGYAYEAAIKLVELAFSEYGISELQAFTTKENIDSQRLLEKLGMMLSGTTFIPNDEEELLLYRLKKKV